MRDLPENMGDRSHSDQVRAKHFGSRGEAFPPLSYQFKAKIYCGNASPLQIFGGKSINLITRMLRPNAWCDRHDYHRVVARAFPPLSYQFKPKIYCGNASPLQISVGKNININIGMRGSDRAMIPIG